MSPVIELGTKFVENAFGYIAGRGNDGVMFIRDHGNLIILFENHLLNVGFVQLIDDIAYRSLVLHDGFAKRVARIAVMRITEAVHFGKRVAGPLIDPMNEIAEGKIGIQCIRRGGACQKDPVRIDDMKNTLYLLPVVEIIEGRVHLFRCPDASLHN